MSDVRWKATSGRSTFQGTFAEIGRWPTYVIKTDRRMSASGANRTFCLIRTSQMGRAVVSTCNNADHHQQRKKNRTCRSEGDRWLDPLAPYGNSNSSACVDVSWVKV
jgi:hypothetical protein